MKRICVSLLIIAIFFSSLNGKPFAAEVGKKYPEKYDLRQLKRVTSVKEQGELGSCWALTSMAALESTLKAKEKKDYDFSENNLITQLSNVYGDGFDRNIDDGGDDALSAAYFASWRGPVLEKDDSYSKTMASQRVVTGLKPVKHVQEIIFLPQRKSAQDNDLIKEHVMKYGAISISMWKGSSQTFGPFYNEEKFAWYYPYDHTNKEGNAHAVNIVGWDDSFSKESFKIKPPGDGAFIVKNTKGSEWGQSNRAKNMGGYFYISYYDMMLGSKFGSNVGSAVFTRVDDTNNYDNIYQYDILGYTKSINCDKTAMFSNIFEINKGKNERLAAVSFYTLEEDLNYEIWANQNSVSGDLLANAIKLTEGNINLPGYHTIDITNNISLTKDKKVAVIVKLTSSKVKPSIAIESPGGIMSTKAKASRGESYYFDEGKSEWSDLTNKEKGSNVCLKVFTKNSGEDNAKLLSSVNMKADIDFIVGWIKSHQPIAKKSGYTKSQKQIIDWAYTRIKQPLCEEDFYLIINRLFTMMGDGHTILHYSPQTTYLNIPFVWLNSGIFIKQASGEFLAGDKILSIGGKNPAELTTMLYEQISSENDYWIRYKSILYLNSRVFLECFKLVNNDGTVDIKIERDNRSLVIKKGFENVAPDMDSYNSSMISWNIEKNNNLGYFRFDDFASGEKLEEIKKEMDKFFLEVSKNKIGNIVFDLRNNNGGTSGALNYMFKYLMVGKVYAEGNELYDMVNKIPKASKDLVFAGKTYFMTSNETFSCAVLATMLMRDNNIIKVVGEPTGENPAFNRHGSGSDGILPKTKWEFMMTSYAPKRPLNKDIKEKAIFPDVPIYTTIEDVLTERDIQRERFREVTRGGNYIYNSNSVELTGDKILLKEGNGFYVDRDESIIANFDIDKINNQDIYLEKTIDGERLEVQLEKQVGSMSVTIPKEVDPEGTYYLVINHNNKKYAVLVSKVKNEKINNKNVEDEFDKMSGFYLLRPHSGDVYRPSWGVIVISFSKDVKSFDCSKVTIKDEDGKLVTIDKFGVYEVDRHSTYIQPRSPLTSGKTYVLNIPKDSYVSMEGEKYSADITISINVK